MRSLLLSSLAAAALFAGTAFSLAEPAETTGSLPRATTQPASQPDTLALAMSDEQRSKVRDSVMTTKAPRVTNARFPLDVGAKVKTRVRPLTVPPELVEVHPGLRGYSYFVVGDDIVIVEPGTLRIVAVLPV